MTEILSLRLKLCLRLIIKRLKSFCAETKYKLIRLFKLDSDVIFLYSKICADVSSSEIDPGIQFQIPGIETMKEYIL
jgi:hypothetical protein